jgi:hypothetical protein
MFPHGELFDTGFYNPQKIHAESMEEDLLGLMGFRAAEVPDAAAAYDSVYPRELSELHPRATAPKWRPATKTQAMGPRVCKN